jgi:hypothetical protein
MSYVIYPSKNIFLKMVTKRGAQNMYEATPFITQQIYIFIYALVGLVSHNESSVHGHESFKTNSHNSAAI